MGQVTGAVVNKFNGLTLPARTNVSSIRRRLDTPRHILNMHVNEFGQFYMPPADATLVHDLTNEEATAATRIRSIWYLDDPRGVVVQTDVAIYWFELRGSTNELTGVGPIKLATPSNPDYPIWVNSTKAGYSLMGYSARGSATGGQTWKLEEAAAPTYVTVTDISASQPDSGAASASILYKGRRFLVNKSRSFHYSDLNDYITFAAASSNKISGDDAGMYWQDAPGFVQGMHSLEDYLIFFLFNQIWILTGEDEDTFRLRQVQTTIGCDAQNTIRRAEDGIYLVGNGIPNADKGLYRFTGSQAYKVSQAVEQIFRFGNLDAEKEAWFGNIYAGKYYLSGGNIYSNYDMLVYDFESQQWTAFGGWVGNASPQVGIAEDLYFSVGAALYQINDNGQKGIYRPSGVGAELKLGWEDEEQIAGLTRFMAFKLFGKYTGTGQPTITVTATDSEGGTVADTQDLPSDTYEGLLFPLGLRGAAIDLDIDITPADDDNEVLIEGVELITSRKGPKVSRT